jgi:murein DD-endopeptidase MepM/ murein hydrolase activator NlpD
VLGWNVLQADQDRLAFASAPQQRYIDVDPSRAGALLAAIDQYTPLLSEQSVDIDVVLGGSDIGGFVAATATEHPYVTTGTKLEETYVVQKGDTITGIADKFGLHVATIAERNQIGIEEIERIKPGTELVIPAEDTSNSKEWLVQLNQKKEEERQRALAEAAKRAKAVAQSKAASRSKATSRQRANGEYAGVAGMNFVVPISHNGISRGLSSYHMGYDYRAPEGTPVRAAQEGRVIETTSGWAGGFGISILVDHGGGLTTRYAHLSRIGVAPGQTVGQGETIGWSGNTGYSTGPHLHFETRAGGRAVDPF